MSKEKKLKRSKKGLEKKKILKVGGLWVDSLSFPAFDDEKNTDPSSES